MFEPAVARVAAARVTDEDLADLQRILDAQRQKLKAGRSAIVEDTAFHAALARATRNRVVVQHHGNAEQPAVESRKLTLKQKGRPERSIQGHEAVVAALRRRDADAAARRDARAHRTDRQPAAAPADTLPSWMSAAPPARYLARSARRADSKRGREIRLTRSVDATRDVAEGLRGGGQSALRRQQGPLAGPRLQRGLHGARRPTAAWSWRRTRQRSSNGFSACWRRAAASLSRMDDVTAASTGAAPRPRRFDFVHNAALRPVFEQAFDDSRAALERGDCAWP